MAATWSLGIGVLIFAISLILASVFYFRYRKIYLIAFTASIASYVFGVFYAWDVFSLSKESILLILLISTGLMFLLGRYFQKRIKLVRAKK